MKFDREHKVQRLGSHIPGFVGYRAVHYLETDLLLRRYLVAKVAEVRDRLADLLATGSHPEALREKLALSLKTLAFLKEEITPGASAPAPGLAISVEAEERLFDFDLVLLDKVAALQSQLDRIEAASAPEEAFEAQEVFDEGLAEIDDLFRMRRLLLAGGEA